MNIPDEIGHLLDRMAGNSILQTPVFKPEFIRIQSQDDLKKFQRILEIPNLVVIDEIYNQLKELIRLQNPGLKLVPADYDVLIKKHIQNIDMRQYGVWVFYPWSNRFVHLLDENEFIEVRTSRNQYKISPEERDILSKKKIGVIGLSVGQSVSVTLAMERICGELRLADFDALELTNLNRIRTGVHNLGLLKVYAVAREIAEIDPFLNVICFADGLTESNMDDFFLRNGKLDLVVEESDGFDIKILSRYKARDLMVPVIMEASDRCMVDVERFDLETNRPILHGIVQQLDIPTLKSLKSNEEKIPYMFDILGIHSTSAKLKASMLEMQQTLTTWPQLASAVTMGGGITADVSRRILLNDFKSSGRFYVDIDELIGDPKIETKKEKIETPQINAEFKSEVLPALFSDAEESDLALMLEAGRLAPSFGNLQNWKWSTSNGNLFLWTSPSVVPNFDPDGNYNLFSCGMAVENVIQKAYQLQLIPKIKIKPNQNNDQLLVQFGFRQTKETQKNLAEFISRRRTVRCNSKVPLDLNELDALLRENLMMANISMVSDETAIDNLAGAFAKAEKIMLLHPDLHKEFFEQILNLNTAETNTGISLQELSLPEAMNMSFSVLSDSKVAHLLNKWNKGLAFEKYFKELYKNSNAFVLISKRDSSDAAVIEAGRDAERIWLALTKNNLAVHPICVSLTLLNLLKSKKEHLHPFTSPAKTELLEMKVLMESLFGVDHVSQGLYLFRVTALNENTSNSKRRPIHELYFSKSGDNL